MNYHISTSLITQEFPKNCECPLCSIKKIVERNILEQFLNDAVMEDDTRARVNKLGFCKEHYDKLFQSQNKLSLALQAQTRMRTLQKLITVPTNPKSAKKQAQALKETEKTCIVCDLIEFNMIRYYKTIAEMYFNEPDFRETLKNTKGFCLPHYAELMEYSNYAHSKAKEYIKDLAELQQANLERMQNELQRFCDSHDYRNRQKPLGSASDILPRMRTKFYGEKF